MSGEITKNNTVNVLARIKAVKVFIFDVDGVLTNGTLLLLENGLMARTMHVKDGYALQLAIKRGYHIIIISGAENGPVVDRLRKLGITQIYMGVKNKLNLAEELLANLNLGLESTLFMGDDMPDLALLDKVGFPCCPADACFQAKAVSTYISRFSGGTGCVRDVIEKVLTLNGHWHEDETIASI